MQAHLLDKRAVGTPWLEREVGAGEPPSQHYLQSFPFSIGRVAAADLQIDAPRVSREHAIILREGKTYRIRDLGSTNGTLLNGQRIQEALLRDGDILAIADAEFTFYSSHSTPSSVTMTQVMNGSAAETENETPRDVVRALRRLQEARTQRAVDVRYQPIADLRQGSTMGYEAAWGGPDGPANLRRAELTVSAAAARVSGQLTQLARMIAVEEVGCDRGQLFLPVDPAEIGSRFLFQALERLRSLAGDHARLVVQLPEASVSDGPYFRQLQDCLKALGIGLAYDGFAAGKAQVEERQAIPPDFLKLAPTAMQGLSLNSDRLRQVQLVVQACHDLGCLAVATGIRTHEEAAVCREAGCDLAQGELFGAPQSVEFLFPRS